MKKTFALFALLSICLITWAQTPVIVTKEIKTINGKNYYAHVVEKGQTVFSIARAYGVNYHDAVLKSDIDKIAIGDTVFLPTNEKPAPTQFHYYVVKQGNTLYSIAKTYQVEVDDILKLNPKIENNHIKVGEVIKIPMEKTKKAETPKPQPTTPRSQNILDQDNSQPKQQPQAKQSSNNEKQLTEKEKKALEKQQKEAEAKAKKEQERLEKEAKQKEAKEKKELEKQLKEAQEAEAKAKKEREKLQKELEEREAKEKKNLEKQKKEAEAKERKEQERILKEMREKEAKEKKELEKRQKEAAKNDADQAKHNPKAEYRKIDKENSGPKNYDESHQLAGNTMQQPEPIAKNEPATKPAETEQPKQPAQPKTEQVKTITFETKPEPQPTPEQSSYAELPLQTAHKIGKSVESPNLVIRDRVDKNSIQITLMIPLYLNNINEISTSKFDIEQRRKRKYKSFEFIQFYEGMMIGLESLKNEGCNVVLNVVDIPGDLPDKVTQAFADYNISNSDLIVALLEKNAFEKAAELAQKNNVFILNPFSQRPEILDKNPYVVKLYPSYQGIVASIIEMAGKNYSSPNFFIVHSNAKSEKRLLDEFQKQFKEQNKSQYTIFDWSANAKLVGMLKNSTGDNIVINIYDQNKDKNKTQSSLILNRLFSIKKNTPTLITLPNWTTKYEDVDYAQLQRLNYHFCSNFYLDYNNYKHKNFIDKFKDKFKTEPIGNYAALGNDIIIHFASGINRKGTEKFWQDPNIERKHSMMYHFYFKRSDPDKGFENQNAYFYRLNTKFQFVPAN